VPVPELVVPVLVDPVPPELGVPVLVDPVPPALPEPLLPVEAAVVVEEVNCEAFWRASAGSWPVTRVTVISSQVAMNRATAAATTRRRIIRTRARRACLILVASAGVMLDRMRRLCRKRVSAS
jgi:hypothetical protein